MSEIKILPAHLADLIAAGEVVERPASVIKELLENSFDAGAGNITAELRGGGLTYIRVTDDGCGMSPEDAGIAFLRHATSKLSSERSLEAIGTFGFRGEALAAISACSRIELLTGRGGEEDGCRVVLEAGEIIEAGPCGCPKGTTVIVRDLFYNTPARLKFIKSERAEASACLGLALRCALGRPEVSVRCVKDGGEEFFSPGDGNIRSCVYSLLGREVANSMLDCETERDGVRVHGFVSSPANGRGNRAQQYFFCNGRAIRSATMQAALEQAYKNTLLTGRFPACVLYVEISPGAVDVNVHPAKAEVRFSNEKAVFDGVYYAALAALGAESRVPGHRAAEPAGVPEAPPDERPELFYLSGETASPPRPAAAGGPAEQGAAYRDAARPAVLREPAAVYRAGAAVFIPAAQAPEAPPPETPKPAPPRRTDGRDGDFMLVGEALGTYIIVERGDTLTFIDKHAAHERVIFDRLKNEGFEVMSQVLLTPAVIHSDGEAVELAAKNAGLLSELGFELEPFGGSELILRALPSYADEGGAEALVEEVIERLRRGALGAKLRDELLWTVACKAAIKAGRRSDPKELAELAGRVMSGEIKYCPHGRPVSFTMEKRDLDRQIKRIL